MITVRGAEDAGERAGEDVARVFRSGAREYEINGSSCRLLDVEELLSDSAIGCELYVLVGQGQPPRTGGGLTADELLGRAADQDDERRIDLLANALRAAVADSQKDLVEFYGRIAASGVLAEDDAAVDDAARVLRTVAALDLVDLKTLLLLTEPGNPAAWNVSVNSIGGNSADRGVLLVALPQLEPVVDAVLAKLEGAGLISTRTQAGPNFGVPDFAVTSFARTCRAQLDLGGAERTDNG